MTSLGNWTFVPYPSFLPTVFANTALWNVSNAVKQKEYQIQISWPFKWESREVAKPALAMYLLDGNALGMTASEAFKRRNEVEFAQPDSVVVSIGYPLTDTVYGLTQRAVDFRPPIPSPENITAGADDFIEFIDEVLRPWVHDTVFPSVEFTREALYGHSWGGIFTIWALITRPDWFDTFFSVSPAVYWNNGSILDVVTEKLGNGTVGSGSTPETEAKPKFFLGYGALEQFPVRRRTETEEAFQQRKSIIQSFQMTDYSHELFYRIEGSKRMKDVQLREYAGQDHFGAASSAITEGIDYFLDW
ncbi:hypothetical protein SMACR_00552 [Sordaria macrospora]|uniref:WGS project CABT00000000 data, contig 2.1 n=2 Tax=Sordaria macrospora TaxID=5147 RepID=F7VLF9_SORMK|nr:uncharacterized protein SMAC_00552 [Sordaria macrospora k-hell]KAA8635457.1 hypothetical protein SMACR_00552 [Sordaria macrospora]KAH7627476.1 Alpha/Beta hydrolase protein [Sordaria sp. MPI-SDFR-AT-0083]WPJ59303.1 hypothetical protein SMAC4_00552 [Sordaria macrospora]CCC06337.1 unnamed protein product [Sordaria macrospora k-hell]